MTIEDIVQRGSRHARFTSGTIDGVVIGGTDPQDATVDELVSNGNHTQPNMPAFLAYANAAQNNVTGDGTNYTVQFNTEVFDRGGDFASNTFTAPVAGIYRLTAAAHIQNAAGSGNVFFDIVTSNRTFRHLQGTSGENETKFLSCLADMDAGDTAIVQVAISALGGDTADIYGDAGSLWTYFCGELVG